MHNNFIHLYQMHTVPRTIGYGQVLDSHRMQEMGHLHLFGAGRFKDNIYTNFIGGSRGGGGFLTIVGSFWFELCLRISWFFLKQIVLKSIFFLWKSLNPPLYFVGQVKLHSDRQIPNWRRQLPVFKYNTIIS